jgi:hypothetical protein
MSDFLHGAAVVGIALASVLASVVVFAFITAAMA